MSSSIDFLSPGDTIAIVAPAKAIEAHCVSFAKSLLEKRGFQVIVGEHCLGQHHYFSGTVDERLQDFQTALNDPSIKAVLCARGGYGCVQLVDLIDWNAFQQHPKWIIGFSDVTVFHNRIAALGYKSVHGSMPLNFEANTTEAIDTLLTSITQPSYQIAATPHPANCAGTATGKLVGGNLSILYSLLGTNDELELDGAILFVEDLAEHLYAIDRMLYALKKSGQLEKIKGLVVGGMTNMKDTEMPFGHSLEEIILAHAGDRNIPICFGFPAGHIDDNRALRLGATSTLVVDNKSVTLSISG